MRRIPLALLLAVALMGGVAQEFMAQSSGAGKAPAVSKPGSASDLFKLNFDAVGRNKKRLVLLAGDPSRNLSGLSAWDVSGRRVSFAGGDGASPLTMVSFFSSSC